MCIKLYILHTNNKKKLTNKHYRLPRVIALAGPSGDSFSAGGRCTPCLGRRRTSPIVSPSVTLSWSWSWKKPPVPHIYCRPTPKTSRIRIHANKSPLHKGSKVPPLCSASLQHCQNNHKLLYL